MTRLNDASDTGALASGLCLLVTPDFMRLAVQRAGGYPAFARKWWNEGQTVYLGDRDPDGYHVWVEPPGEGTRRGIGGVPLAVVEQMRRVWCRRQR